MIRSYKKIILGVVFMNMISIHAQKKEYAYVFNPIKGMVNDVEKPFRKELCLSGKWQFMPVYDTLVNTLDKPKEFLWETTPIKIPSPWNVNNFATDDGGDFVTFPSYPERWNDSKKGWLKKTFNLPRGWKKDKIKLYFEAIAGHAQVYVNGILVGENLDIYFPFNIDVSDFLNEGKNEIIVGVTKASLTDQEGKYGRRNYVAGSFWGQHIVGIWQDVYLLNVPNISIDTIFIEPDVANNELKLNVKITNNTDKPLNLDIEVAVREWIKSNATSLNDLPVESGALGSVIFNISTEKSVQVLPNTSKTIHLTKKINGALKYWTPESPNLYGAVVSLKKNNKKVIDKKYERFGWRQFSIEGTQLKLNGNPIVLKGDSWHFMGIPQMTRRYAYGWYKMLKDANSNAVRLHAMPFPEFYLDVADEMGICVLDETAIWSSDGGPKMDSEGYWSSCKQHVKNLVLRDRNHPSVFGWSVCNETLPVAIHVFNAPENIVQRQVDEINNWVEIVKTLDPTRPWISGDGETMRKTNLPTVIGHYGGEEDMKKWASQGIPWGVGETGMGYYGTPTHVSAINGGRSFESMQGRMEGLAIEGYGLITKQLENKASYTSLFNLIWYGLKPLALGLKNTSRPSTPEDGIFFTNYQEGVPGVQPERLGPYTTTINPGYDMALPLYKPWPLFYAVKAANAGESFELSSKKSNKKNSTVINELPPPKSALFFSKQKEKNEILKRLKAIGVNVNTESQDPSKTILIIDGKNPVTDTKTVLKIKTLVEKGALTYVWGVSEKTVSDLNNLLPFTIELSKREATSFLVKNNDALVSGIGIQSLYFTEVSSKKVLQNGLKGDILKNGKVIIEASNTDWARWNHRPEYLKTAAIIRSERETKEEGATVVKYQKDNNSIYVNAMDTDVLGDAYNGLLKQMFSNIGVDFSLNKEAATSAVNEKGYLTKALVLGRFEAEGMNLKSMADKEFINESTLKPNFNTRVNGKFWELKNANETFRFDFKSLDLIGSENNAVSYISFWVYSPRSLVNLLAEPNMPKLGMKLGADDGFKIYLNNKSLFEDIKPGGLVEDEYFYDRIPLEKGWNHMLIKSLQLGGDWELMMRFICNDPNFFKKLNFKVDK